MTLTGKQKHHLRGLAHHKKPVVMIADAGLTETVQDEINKALAHHELIKIKIRAEREERAAILEKICADTGAEAVQSIGQVAVLYLRGESPTIQLPK